MRSTTLRELAPWLSPLSSETFANHPFSTVEQGLYEVDADAPEHPSPACLRAEIEWLLSIQRSVEAMAARRLARLDRLEQESASPSRGPGAPPDPDAGCARWLHDRLQLTPEAAHAQLRTARQLEDLPRTAAAQRRGQLSAQHVAVICRAMAQVPRTCLDPAEVESALLHAARRMDPRELHRHWLRLRYQADQEAGLEAEREQHRRRWLRLTRTWHDTYRIEGELDAEGGGTLKKALRGLIERRLPDDHRDHDQRRADAMVELARRRLDAGDLPERGGEKPHLVVVAELATLRLEPGSRLAELDWGALVSGETARRIGCDAAITPVLVDEGGRILHLGRRTRSVSPRLRRELNLRDRHCQWAGCTVPAEECVSHHHQHFADGGPTTEANLGLYCIVHHAMLHPENDCYRRAP